MLLKKTGGHWFFLKVNVTCVDLVSFILISHLVAQDKFKYSKYDIQFTVG
jgi:hypothetical protein